jgi:hypothetical protein
MAGAVGAVASGLAAAAMGLGKGAWEQIVGKMKTAHEFKLTLAQSRSLKASRFVVHLIVLIR